MKKTALIVLTLALARHAPADTMTEAVQEALGIFQTHHLKLDDAATRRAVIQSIARTADPGAETVTADEAKHRRDELSGMDFSAGFRLSITNGLPVVIEVMTNGPAQKAGLQLGDVIMSIDGALASDGRRSMNQVARIKPSDKISIQVMRNGKELNLTAEVGLRPPQEQPPQSED